MNDGVGKDIDESNAGRTADAIEKGGMYAQELDQDHGGGRLDSPADRCLVVHDGFAGHTVLDCQLNISALVDQAPEPVIIATTNSSLGHDSMIRVVVVGAKSISRSPRAISVLQVAASE